MYVVPSKLNILKNNVEVPCTSASWDEHIHTIIGFKEKHQCQEIYLQNRKRKLHVIHFGLTSENIKSTIGANTSKKSFESIPLTNKQHTNLVVSLIR
jgi:hypothetical protein